MATHKCSDPNIQLDLPLEALNAKGVSWEPLPDITTYELALAVSFLLLPSQPSAETFLKLPMEVRRHFKYRYTKV